MSEQLENLYKLMTLRRLLSDFSEQLTDYAESVDNLRERFVFPDRAFRRKAIKVDENIRYKASVWHLQDPAYSESYYTVSCCRRGDYENETVEWKELAGMTNDDTLCTICFRPILRPTGHLGGEYGGS